MKTHPLTLLTPIPQAAPHGVTYRYGVNREKLVEDLLAEYASVCLESHDNGGEELWMILHYPDRERGPYICLFLLVDGLDGWGYKDMAEDLEPFYGDLPVAWFDKYPTTNAKALKWRHMVKVRQSK